MEYCLQGSLLWQKREHVVATLLKLYEPKWCGMKVVCVWLMTEIIMARSFKVHMHNRDIAIGWKCILFHNQATWVQVYQWSVYSHLATSQGIMVYLQVIIICTIIIATTTSSSTGGEMNAANSLKTQLTIQESNARLNLIRKMLIVRTLRMSCCWRSVLFRIGNTPLSGQT